jgi:hypothetical protein
MNHSRLWKRIGFLSTAMFWLSAAGCSNKGGYAGKVTVVVGDRLKAKGVELVDWRYSASAKSFGFKLRAQQPVEDHLKITTRISGRGAVSPVGSVGRRINNGEWIDVGGRLMGQFGNIYP